MEQRSLPFADAIFDVVISFQVIEHVPDPDRYVQEALRVLRPGGVFMIATPDATARLYRWQRPWNPFHRVEFTPDQLELILRRKAPDVRMMGMGGAAKYFDQEFARYRKLRLLGVPFTVPWFPERWRQFGLSRAKAILRALHGARSSDETETEGGHGVPTVAVPDAERFGYGTEVVEIRPGIHPSVNLVAVVVKASTGAPVVRSEG